MEEIDKPQIAKKTGRPRARPSTSFGAWFMALKNSDRITHLELAEVIGCGEKYVDELVQGRRSMSIEKASLIAKFSEEKGFGILDLNSFVKEK